MRVTKSNSVALNLLPVERVRELADDMRVEQVRLRARYAVALAELAVARDALDDCTTTLGFVRLNAERREF